MMRLSSLFIIQPFLVKTRRGNTVTRGIWDSQKKETMSYLLTLPLLKHKVTCKKSKKLHHFPKPQPKKKRTPTPEEKNNEKNQKEIKIK